ncbi:ATP-binding protein [Streptomyces arenae]|uniref:ATP-binding protein n=1 Tax=Streptomyces arenae TaxID=29301 RepID=UPI002657C58A|nr:ATP-binding protein [Streptomyces arenae]MCG7206068.1 ATP-binding protein [Streptomyces arenae]
MIKHPSRHCSVELQALPSRIGQVRRIVSAQLRYWRLDPLIDRAALGVTELLTNVHRHAQPDKNCTVEIELQLDRLTVSVRDHDPRLPVVGEGTAAAPMATCGRGLAMVAAVSESWGVRPHDDGKVVWFTLPAPTATAQATRPPHRAAEPVPRRIVEAEPATAGMPTPAHAMAGSPAAAHASAGSPAAVHATTGPPVAAGASAPAATHTATGVSAAGHAPARSAVVS